MPVTVPSGLRSAVVDGDGGPEWLDSIPARAARARERRDRGWWTGYRGADGDFIRAGAWATATNLLGG